MEPRETHITEMAGKIDETNLQLNYLSQRKQDLEVQITELYAQLAKSKTDTFKEHQRAQRVTRYIKAFKNDLEEVIGYFQDTATLKKMVENFYIKYCRGESVDSGVGIDQSVRTEYAKQQEQLKETITQLRKKAEVNSVAFRAENTHTITANQQLIGYGCVWR